MGHASLSAEDRVAGFVQRLLLSELTAQLEAMVAQLARSLALLKRWSSGLWDGENSSVGPIGPSKRWAPFFVRAEDLRNELVSKGLDVQMASQVVQRSIWKFQKAVVREIERRQGGGDDREPSRERSVGKDSDKEANSGGGSRSASRGP